jgi:hypothetical protein
MKAFAANLFAAVAGSFVIASPFIVYFLRGVL